MTADREYMTVEECERLGALLANATPGPWWWFRERDDRIRLCSDGGQMVSDPDVLREADASLIVYLVSAAPRLLSAATEYARWQVVVASEALEAAYREGFADGDVDNAPDEAWSISGAKQVADEIAAKGRTDV